MSLLNLTYNALREKMLGLHESHTRTLWGRCIARPAARKWPLDQLMGHRRCGRCGQLEIAG